MNDDGFGGRIGVRIGVGACGGDGDPRYGARSSAMQREAVGGRTKIEEAVGGRTKLGETSRGSVMQREAVGEVHETGRGRGGPREAKKVLEGPRETR